MLDTYAILKRLLFRLPPETAHAVTFQLMKGLNWCPFLVPQFNDDKLKKKCMNLEFANPIGLSAGLDKNGECLNIWPKLGFGFIEVGTVTPRPQVGNPKPRLFRLVQDRALINRLGFNNDGVDALVSRLEKYQGEAVLGVNIGKNKDTPNEQAHQDYLTCFHKVAPFADYITINISSPNTPNLRELQNAEFLSVLLEKLKSAQSKYQSIAKPLPICVKIAPDMTEEALSSMLDILLSFEVEGIIATNTTIQRDFSLIDENQQQSGGLSGAPILSLSNKMLKYIKEKVGEKIVLIGSGGIVDSDGAQSKIQAGADLLQLYTGLIYKGPNLISEVLEKLNQDIKENAI